MTTIQALLQDSSKNAEGNKTVIEFLPIRATANLSEEIAEILDMFKIIDTSCQQIIMHLSGHYNRHISGVGEFPINFYNQLGIDWKLATSRFFVPCTPKSTLLSGLLTYIPYIFIHDISSTESAGRALEHVISKLQDKFFLVNPEKNMYPEGHVFYELADQFLREKRSLTLIDYKATIEGAAELHMITSCYFCFAAALLGVNAKVKVAYSRNGDRFPTIASDWKYIDI